MCSVCVCGLQVLAILIIKVEFQENIKSGLYTHFMNYVDVNQEFIMLGLFPYWFTKVNSIKCIF